MAVIHKLSAEIIGQIAAGEVVERPASAVKELVENSIDAGAKNITVELREGGITYLRITDNGCGIPPEQLRLAFERHATSKMTRAEDLFDLHTLGFRGEALASIAAVARVTMTTCTREASFGSRCVVEGGEFQDIRQAASPVGTSIVVENLFQNVPARLKFLKKPSAEASLVADYMSRLILSRPEIAFRFVSQGKTLFRSPGDGRPESALLSIYGRETLAAMKKVEGHQSGLMIRGYVGVGDQARGNHQQQTFLINGRYFRSSLLSKAVDEACSCRVMAGRFPICVLNLEIDPRNVDVNVHPNKLEVRFQNETAAADAVRQVILEALSGESLSQRLTRPQAVSPIEPEEREASGDPSAKKSPVRVIPLEAPGAKSCQRAAEESLPKAETAVKPPEDTKKPPVQELSRKASDEEPHQPVVYGVSPEAAPCPAVSRPAVGFPPVLREESTAYQPRTAPAAPEKAEQTELPREEELRYIGSAFQTYLIFEGRDRVLVVDQHAAHERILYDKYLAMITGGRASQQLLSPVMVHLSPAEMLALQELLPVLTESGFELSVFDEQNVALRAVPMLFGVEVSPKELLLEVMDEWDGSKKQITPERMRRRVAQMACKHAIKGGDALNRAQVKAFLDMCLKSHSYPACPHGRPIVIEISQKDIEKRFSRIQP